MLALSAATPELADLYRRLHRGTPGDLAFYLRACSGAGSILELGAGAGRVTSSLARAGHRVTALELSPHLLDLAAEAIDERDRERVSLIQGDMCEVALEGRFDRVIIPFTGLYALTTHDQMRRCLTAARAHLSPAGVLICDVYAVDEDACGPGQAEQTDWEALHEVALDDGGTVIVWERNRFDGTPCRVDVDYRYVWPDGRVVTDTIAHRFLSFTRLRELLVEAGYTAIDIRGDFQGSPFDLDSELMVVTAR